MPYFSFTLDKNILISSDKDLNKFKTKKKYFSKNTKLWSKLNKLNKKIKSIEINKEERQRYITGSQRILFCLPPNIGLGDAIEYALGIKSIIINFKKLDVGVAYTGKFKDIFKISNTFDFISEDDLDYFHTTFHFTLEINDLKYQKYNRHDIEKLITNFFHTQVIRRKLRGLKSKNNNVLSIFPVSNSPIRSLPINILKEIILEYNKIYKIDIYLISGSVISDYIYQQLNHIENIKFKNPKNLDDLILDIRSIKFGIFCDSGPLHIAKLYNKPGLLIVSTVSEKILLNNFPSIKSINSNYSSNFCNGPCGLVNVFEFNSMAGCYDSMNIKKDLIIAKSNLNLLQRGNLKNNYLNLYIKSVNCYKKFNTKKINMLIKDLIKLN